MPDKYRAYIDESGHSTLSQIDDANSRFFTIACAIFKTDYVADYLAPPIDKLKRDFFPPHHPDNPVVLHATEIKGKRFPFNSLKSKEICTDFDNALLGLLESLDFSIICVTVDKNSFSENYPNWKVGFYELCFYNLIERYYLFLQDCQSVGDVMIESRNSRQDQPVKDLYKAIYQKGTDRIKGFDSRITSCELKVKPKEMNIPGLQIADIICNPIRRYMLSEQYKYKVGESSFCDSALKILFPKIRKSKSGQVWGFGLKAL